MDTLRLVEFDIHGVKPINKIDMEEISIEDKCPWVIPNGSPFFGDYPGADGLPLTIVYDESGAELTRDRDYFLEEEFIPLVVVTGRPITCFVRLSDEVLANNKKIKISYRSVGAYFVPRNSLQEWIKQIQTGVVPIPWDKVFDVPPTLPSEWHSHTIKTEIGDWFELTWFYAYFEKFISTKDPQVEVIVDQAIRAAFDLLYQTRDAQQAALNSHDRNYQRPHGTTKGDVLLGNHDNFATGNINDHRIGTRADLFATPQGIQTIIEDNVPDTSELMKNGVLPLSRFGKSGYLPPSITGSFEGLGSRSECMGMCVEADGRMMILQNHFDGRDEGLYFSTLDNYNKLDGTYEFLYTSYKYRPPVLTNIGVTPDNIANGSGNDLIFVVQSSYAGVGSDRYFLALTNNSFDPAGHRYIETGMQNVFANQPGQPSPKGENISRMNVSLVDDWAILAVTYYPFNKDTANPLRDKAVSFYRIPKSALIAGTPANWELLKITYVDYDGVARNAETFFSHAARQVTGDKLNKWGGCGFRAPLPPAGLGYYARRLAALVYKKSSAPNMAYFNFATYMGLEYIQDALLIGIAGFVNMVYELNLATGVMTLLSKTPLATAAGDGTTNELGEQVFNYSHITDCLVRFDRAGMQITPNGEMLSSLTENGSEFQPLKTFVRLTKFTDPNTGAKISSQEALVSRDLGKKFSTPGSWEFNRVINSPIPSGIATRQVAYETGGESFVTNSTKPDPNVITFGKAEVMYREVAGDFAVRPQVTNTTLSPLYSRPLTNKVYRTNLDTIDSAITITGDAATLAAKGSDAGQTSYSTGYLLYSDVSKGQDPTGQVYYHAPSAALSSPNGVGAVITFPKTHRRELNVETQRMNYIGNDFYGVSSALVNKIFGTIPLTPFKGPVGIQFSMVNGESGTMFEGIDVMFIMVEWTETPEVNTGRYSARLYVVQPVVEAPNTAHPGCHLITDYNVLDVSAIITQHTRMTPNQPMFPTSGNRGLMSFYRTGNTAQIVLFGPWSISGGNSWTFQNVVNFDLTTKTLSNLKYSMITYEWADSIAAIPKVGVTDFSFTGNEIGITQDFNVMGPSSGYACRIMQKTVGGNKQYYAVATAYPEVAWGVFLLENVEVMFNGTLYRLPIGTIDLRDIDPTPQNKTFWLYATVEDQTARYVITSTKLRHSSTLILAAVIKTGPNQILSIDRRQPFMIGDLELSYTRQGGSIPVSSGFPQEAGNFTFLRQGELLP